MAHTLAATLALGLLGSLGSLAATAHAAPPTPLACGTPPTAPPRAITAVDWCSLDGVAWKGRLVDGHSEVHLYRDLGKPHDTISTRIVAVDYADLDGDRRPEAFVVVERATWIADRAEPSVGTDVLVFAWRRGAPVRLGELPVGTPITDLAIRRGVVTIVSGPDAAATRHRWSPRARAFTALPPPR